MNHISVSLSSFFLILLIYPYSTCLVWFLEHSLLSLLGYFFLLSPSCTLSPEFIFSLFSLFSLSLSSLIYLQSLLPSPNLSLSSSCPPTCRSFYFHPFALLFHLLPIYPTSFLPPRKSHRNCANANKLFIIFILSPSSFSCPSLF